MNQIVGGECRLILVQVAKMDTTGAAVSKNKSISIPLYIRARGPKRTIWRRFSQPILVNLVPTNKISLYVRSNFFSGIHFFGYCCASTSKITNM